MPSIKNQETVDLIAQNYCTNNYNKTKAMVDAGYSPKYADSGNGHRFVFGNVQVKAAIAMQMAKISAKMEVTVEFIVQKLLTGLQLAEEKKDLVAIARFTELLGKYKAMFTDKVQQTGEGLSINITSAPIKQLKQPPVPVLPIIDAEAAVVASGGD